MKYPFLQKRSETTLALSSRRSVFWNITLDKGRVKSFVSWFLENYGEKKTLQLLEELKNLGFGYATKAGVSLGIEDLKIPPNKVRLLAEAENAVSDSISLYRKGEITGIEKVQRFIETWHETSENLKQDVVRYFEKTDLFNPVYMMAFSGARGNLSQVRQLVGMRGLMADPQGKIMDFPILSNFREGLTLTEYLISTYGARKGIVDTALRTATAGYLTRRLVDVAQHILVSKFDCGTQRGIFLFDMKEGNKIIYSFENRLTGRVLAQDILKQSSVKKDAGDRDGASFEWRYGAHRNQEIDPLLAFQLSKIVKKALVRSPLTCETRKSICQLCYGWSLATAKLVSIGEAVGVIAGQSIGEPGTQLTMRTFHTGGVFSGGITEQINAPFSGRVEYSTPIAGSCFRTSQGFLTFLTKTPGTVFLKKGTTVLALELNKSEERKKMNQSDSIKIYKIPPFTILFARHGEFVKKGQVLIQISSLPIGQRTTQTIEQTIYSSLQGEIYFSQLELLEDVDEKYGERISKSEDWGKVWVLASKVSQNSLISLSLARKGDIVLKNSIVNQIQWTKHLTQSTYLKNSFSNCQKLKNFDPYSTLKNSVKSQINVEHAIKNQKRRILVDKKVKHFESPAKMFGTFSSNIFSMLKNKNERRAKQFSDFKKTGVRFHVSIRDKLFFTYPSKKVETSLVYPYPFAFRFHLMKLATKTTFSIPSLQPGALCYWIATRKGNGKKGTNINILTRLKTNDTFLVRRIAMNKRFDSKTIDKPSFLNPLLLSTFIPCLLNNKHTQLLKVFKNHFFRENPIFHNSLINTFLVYPYLTSPLKVFIAYKVSKGIKKSNTDRANNWFNKKFQENLLIKLETRPTFFQKRVFEKDQSSASSRVFSKNSRQQNIVFTKSLQTKSDHFILKTRLLGFNIKNIKHHKLGYFITVKNSLGQKEKFFSFLPIIGGTSIPSSHRYRTQNSHMDKVEKNRVFTFDAFTLKNTDFWARNSGEGFCWFPAVSKINTSCLLSISSPFFQSKKFFKSSFKQEKKYLKKTNSKQTVFSFKNLAQSQTNKKFRMKATILQKKFTRENLNNSSFLEVFRMFQPIKNFSIKNSMNSPFLKSISPDFSKKKAPLSIFKDTNEGQLYLKFSNYFPHFCRPIKTARFFDKIRHSSLNSKAPFSFESNSVHIPPFLRKSYLIAGKENFKELNSSHEKKNKNLFAKKASTISHLKTLTNSLHKSSVNFHEIFCLPQENYLVRSILSRNEELHIYQKIATQQKTSSAFYEPFNFNPLFTNKNLVPRFYLVNAHGLKKLFTFKSEGLFRLQTFTHPFHQVGPIKSGFVSNVNSKTQMLNPLLKKPIVSSIKKTGYVDFKVKKGSFCSLENSKNSTALLLKLRFVNYLRTKKKKNQNASTENKAQFKVSFNNNLQVSLISTTSRPFFSFVPFFKEKKEIETNKQSLKLNQSFKTKGYRSHDFLLNIKPGWVYKTTNKFKGLTSAKSVWFGNIILDDLSFAQKRVRVEKIAGFSVFNSNRTTFPIFHKEYGEAPSYFTVSRNVMNCQSRFPKVYLKKNSIDEKTEKVCPNFYFLIQPFLNKYLPNINKLKNKLYTSMGKQRSDFWKTSHKAYKEYFSNRSNLQQSNLKILNEFLPHDIHLTWLNSFFSVEPAIFKAPTTKTFNKKNRRTTLKKEKFRIQSSNWLFPRFSKNIPQLSERSPFLEKNKVDRVVKKAKTTDVRSCRFNEFACFSYSSFNWSTLKISVDLKNTGFFHTSSTDISFNTINTNIFFPETKANGVFPVVRYQYLQLLMFRSFSNNFQKPLSVSFLNRIRKKQQDSFLDRKPVHIQSRLTSKVSLIDKESATVKISGLFSFLDFVQPMPFFEYSLNKRYAFFANQKLFSSSFYESQVRKFFKVSVFRDKIFREANLKEDRFINRITEEHWLSDSYRTRSISTNQILFKNVFKNKVCLGITNFYSAFEGEVLHVYNHGRKDDQGKKNFNSYLDKTLLEERRARTTILTKSNIFSLKFFQEKDPRLGSESLSPADTIKSAEFTPFDDPKIVSAAKTFFTAISNRRRLNLLKNRHQTFQNLEKNYFKFLTLEKYEISHFETIYKRKRYKIDRVDFGLTRSNRKFRLGELIYPGDRFYSQRTFLKAGLIVHLNREKLTLRKAEFFSISPQAILHTYNGDFILENQAVMTLPFQTLKTGDIVQGIPKVEQYLEARTTIQGRFFLNSLPVLLDAVYQRYSSRLNVEKAVRQSFLKIQQILVDGVQRVYRSQGVSIADKHLEIIVRQMTSKVKITYGGQTGFFPGELIDLEFVERMNRFLMVKIRYEPVVLGITRASLEVDSFLSAASFQQTTKVLTRAALENKRDFLKGLKENLLVGNLLPAGTGYIFPLSQKEFQA